MRVAIALSLVHGCIPLLCVGLSLLHNADPLEPPGQLPDFVALSKEHRAVGGAAAEGRRPALLQRSQSLEALTVDFQKVRDGWV